MGIKAGFPAPFPAGPERPPWSAAVPALVCSATALVSLVYVAVKLWRGMRGNASGTFFTDLPWLGLLGIAVVVFPWGIATIGAGMRLLHAHQHAHRSLAALLAPALAVDVTVYLATLLSGRPLSGVPVAFAVWIAVACGSLVLLALRPTRRFQESGPISVPYWSDELLDDGT